MCPLRALTSEPTAQRQTSCTRPTRAVLRPHVHTPRTARRKERRAHSNTRERKKDKSNRCAKLPCKVDDTLHFLGNCNNSGFVCPTFLMHDAGLQHIYGKNSASANAPSERCNFFQFILHFFVSASIIRQSYGMNEKETSLMDIACTAWCCPRGRPQTLQ